MTTGRKKITIELSAEQFGMIQRRAADAGLNVAQYGRREMIRSTDVSRETKLNLAATLRLEELLIRIYSGALEEALTPGRVRQMQREVETINLDPLIQGLRVRLGNGRDEGKGK